MDINIKDTKRKYHFDFQISNDNFQLDEGFSGRIKDTLSVHGKIEKLVENKLLLKFSLEGTIIYPCSRCLEDVPEEINYHFREEIEQNNDGVVPLNEYINDCLYINEPYKVLCREDCLGLCPICGTNLNYNSCNCHEEEDEIDPRLEKLRNLI